MFAGLKIGRSSSSPIELPDWIDENRGNNMKTLKVLRFFHLNYTFSNVLMIIGCSTRSLFKLTS